MNRRLARAFRLHQPVLLNEILSQLELRPGQVVVDATVGSGGHAQAILQHIQPTGYLVGIDRDKEALTRTQERLKPVGGPYVLKHANFRDLDEVLNSLNLGKVYAVLMDIGVSRDQLEDPKRGFSFLRDGPLDMRLDQTATTETAADIVNKVPEKELVRILSEFGEERRARRIAHRIATVREKKPIQTTSELRKLIEEIRAPSRRYHRIHPATRTFQALRIAVNHELEALEQVLPQAFERLVCGGRLAVVSFHSLEDRLVKHFFLKEKQSRRAIILTKKPIRPSTKEIEENPRSRSAKLRVLERTAI